MHVPASRPLPRLGRLLELLKRHRTPLSVAAMVVVVGVAFFTLHALLREVSVAQITAALRALSPHQIAAAAGLTVLSYIVLTGYDVLALRTIGRPLPYPLAAMGSFTSYTLSHNLGFAPVMGGAARWRLYGPAGLTPADIARVVVIAGVTFWLGVTLLLGLALVFEPGALRVHHWTAPYPLQAGIGVLVLLGIAAYLVLTKVRPRPLDILGWHLPIPTTRQAVAQFGLAAADMAVASAALLVLVPQAGVGDLPAFVIAYVIAIVVALLTHAPGGLGVFEAVMLVTLPHVDKATLISALIVYRLIYYLIPLGFSLAILGIHEMRLARARRRAPHAPEP